MPELVNITANTPKATQIWGFHGPCTVNDVANAVKTISSGLSGPNNTIHIMSGTHGYCSGKIGAVATREQKFAEEDRQLAEGKTSDGKPVQLDVRDFNTGNLSAPDVVTGAMTNLNSEIRSIVGNNTGNNVFILAYCCSAGTK